MTLVLKVTCRTCSRECGDYKHLMDETIIDNESTTLALILSDCTGLDLFNENEGFYMPEHICNSCVEHLLQSYLFKEMVLQNDRQMREHLTKSIIEIPERCGLESPSLLEDSKINEEIVNADCNIQDEHVDNIEYEMEEWLEVDEYLDKDLNRNNNESNEYSIVDMKTEKFLNYQDEIDELEPVESEEQENNMVMEAAEELDEEELEDIETMEPDNDYIPSDKENDEENILEKLQRNGRLENDTNTEDESIIKNTIHKPHAKRKSLKDGNLSEADLTCKDCGKVFTKMCRLREHTYIHTGEKPHMCSVCGKRSRTKTHHNVHMLIHSEQKRYKCTICGQDYRTSNSLRVHERKHFNIKPYVCPVCEKRFHTAEQRKLHVMLHTGERPYSCEKCGKAYRESHSLRLHLQSHENKKPYQCEVCGKGLTQMSGYKRHMLLHTDEHPYKCDVCGRAFRISSNLLTHKRLHLDVLPFQCTHCDKGFTTTSRLRRHMLQHEKPSSIKKSTFKVRKPRAEPVHVEQKMAKSRIVEIL